MASWVKFINRVIEAIEETLKDDFEKPDEHLTDRKKLAGLKLMLLNIDEKVEPGVLVCPD